MKYKDCFLINFPCWFRPRPSGRKERPQQAKRSCFLGRGLGRGCIPLPNHWLHPHRDVSLLLLLFALSTATHAEDAKDLFAAAMMGKVERTEALLTQGIDVNSKNAGGRTALMAASFNGNVLIVKALLAYGADVSLADNVGTTALMDALVFGNEDIVNLLIAAGADVNALDKQNVTVMGRAKKTAHEKVIKILEKAGAKEEADIPIEDAKAKEGAGGKPADNPGAKPTDKPDAKPPAKK
jgi:ankyrin repeat protein